MVLNKIDKKKQYNNNMILLQNSKIRTLLLRISMKKTGLFKITIFAVETLVGR